METEKASSKAFTWATRKASITGGPNKLAITDHVMNTNHIIGWEEASIKERERDRFKRQIKESIWIRKPWIETGATTVYRISTTNFWWEHHHLWTSPEGLTESWVISLRKCHTVTKNCCWGMLPIGFVIMNSYYKWVIDSFQSHSFYCVFLTRTCIFTLTDNSTHSLVLTLNMQWCHIHSLTLVFLRGVVITPLTECFW